MKKWIIIGIILLAVILVSVYFYRKSKKELSTTKPDAFYTLGALNSNLRKAGGICQKCVSRDSKGNCTQWMNAPCDDLAFSV